MAFKCPVCGVEKHRGRTQEELRKEHNLTKAQASMLICTVDDHSALLVEPQRSLRSMVQRCPELFATFPSPTTPGHLCVYPTKLGANVASAMRGAWNRYMRDYEERQQQDGGSNGE